MDQPVELLLGSAVVVDPLLCLLPYFLFRFQCGMSENKPQIFNVIFIYAILIKWFLILTKQQKTSYSIRHSFATLILMALMLSLRIRQKSKTLIHRHHVFMPILVLLGLAINQGIN